MAEKKATKTTKTKKTTAKAAPKTTVKTAPAKKQKSIVGQVICGVIAAAAIIALIIGATVLISNLSKGAKPGTYEVSAIKADGQDQTENLSLLRALGLSATVTLNSDGTCTASIFGTDANSCTYNKEQITIDGESTTYAYTDTTIAFPWQGNELTFTKAE